MTAGCSVPANTRSASRARARRGGWSPLRSCAPRGGGSPRRSASATRVSRPGCAPRGFPRSRPCRCRRRDAGRRPRACGAVPRRRRRRHGWHRTRASTSSIDAFACHRRRRPTAPVADRRRRAAARARCEREPGRLGESGRVPRPARRARAVGVCSAGSAPSSSRRMPGRRPEGSSLAAGRGRDARPAGRRLRRPGGRRGRRRALGGADRSCRPATPTALARAAARGLLERRRSSSRARSARPATAGAAAALGRRRSPRRPARSTARRSAGARA